MAAAGYALQLWQRSGRRRRAMTQVLDAADALEERLRTARVEIEAIVGSAENPVRGAMHEMLRQRLWLQRHGGDAAVVQRDPVAYGNGAPRRTAGPDGEERV